MRLPTEHEEALEEMRRALLAFIRDAFAGKPASMGVTVLTAVTVEMGLMTTTADNPKEALLRAFEQIIDMHLQQEVETPTIQH